MNPRNVIAEGLGANDDELRQKILEGGPLVFAEVMAESGGNPQEIPDEEEIGELIGFVQDRAPIDWDDIHMPMDDDEQSGPELIRVLEGTLEEWWSEFSPDETLEGYAQRLLPVWNEMDEEVTLDVMKRHVMTAMFGARMRQVWTLCFLPRE